MSAIASFFSRHYLLFLVLALFAAVLVAYRAIGIARITSLATRRPWAAIAASLFAVGLLGVGIPRIEIDADLTSLLPKTVQSKVASDRIEEVLGSVERAFVIVQAKSGTIWTPSALAKVKAISDELAAAPYVDSVISLSRSRDVRDVDDSLVVGDMMEGLPRTEAEIAALRDRVADNLVLGKRLVSRDGTTTVISVLLRPVEREGPGGKVEARKASDREICAYDPEDPARPSLENIERRFEDGEISISLSGIPYIRYDASNKMSSDMSFFLPASIAIMLLFLFACFRSLRGMLLPFMVVVSSLAGLYGLMGLLGEKLYFPYIIIGPMFVAIAHNYGTQLIANYYETARLAPLPFDRAAVARSSIEKMGSPILLSASTVIIGFVTMLGHPLPAMASLGYFSAFGIILAFVLTIVLTPAVLSLLPPPAKALAGGQDAAVDRALAAAARFIARFRVAVLAFAAVLAALCATLLPRVVADSNTLGYYKKDSPIRAAADLMGEKFAGAMSMNVLLESDDPAGPDSTEDGVMKSPASLKWMERVQARAESLTDSRTGERLVGDSASLADQVAYMNSAMQGDPALNVVPDDPDLVAQYLLLADEDDLSAFVDSKYDAAQVVVQLPGMDTARVSQVVESLRAYLAEDPPPGFSVAFGGSLTSVYEINKLLVEGQVATIVLSVIVIVACYMLVFRSPIAGLLAAIPLVIAILAVFALMALFGIKLDNVTSILTGIMIGAGTDYTAYFLWRMKELAPSCASLEEAYVKTMETIGKGIVYNGFSVVIGFVVFFWSSFQPVIFFGFLISISIFVCIVGALTALPAAVIAARPKFLYPRSHE